LTVGRVNLAVLCRRNQTAKQKTDLMRRLFQNPRHRLLEAVFVTIDIRQKGQR
jgi:hypothetical protein